MVMWNSHNRIALNLKEKCSSILTKLNYYNKLSYPFSDSARHRSQNIFPPIFQIVLKNFISLIIKEYQEEILIAIVLKISKSSWNTALYLRAVEPD
jgi:hypothetical protein